MNTRKLRLSGRQLDQLKRTLSHVREEEMADHSMGLLSPERSEAVRRHLEGCSDCARELEQLRISARRWEGETGAQRMARLHALVLAHRAGEDALRDLARDETQPGWLRAKAARRLAGMETAAHVILGPWPVGALAPRPALAAAGAEEEDAVLLRASEDDRLRCELSRLAGELWTMIETEEEDLDGATVQLLFRSPAEPQREWSDIVTLRPVGSGLWGATRCLGRLQDLDFDESTALELRIEQ